MTPSTSPCCPMAGTGGWAANKQWPRESQRASERARERERERARERETERESQRAIEKPESTI